MQDRYDEILNQMDSTPLVDDSNPSSPDNTQTPPEVNSGNDQPSSTETQTPSGVNPQDTNPNPPSPDQTTPNEDTNPAAPSNQDEGNDKGKGNQRPKYSHEEQVQYSFSKLNSKLSQTKRELKAALAQIEELKKANAPKPEKLGPEAFGSNEDYLKYIANQTLIEQLQKAAEAKKLSEAEAEASRESKARYTQRAAELFKTQEDIDAYNNIVGRALEEGLNDVLNSDTVISDFIKTSDWAPRLVFHFAAMPEDLERISNIKDPTDKRFALNMLQQRIMTVFSRAPKQNQTTQTQTQTNPSGSKPSQVPIVGKAGTGASGSAGSSSEVTMEEAMAKVRGY